jgi:hypothetical protein
MYLRYVELANAALSKIRFEQLSYVNRTYWLCSYALPAEVDNSDMREAGTWPNVIHHIVAGV